MTADSVNSSNLITRKRAMAAFAAASLEELLIALNPIEAAHGAVDLRRPEPGLVMLRGRIGGNGNPFNLGEASVTRASIRLVTGEIGHAYVLGRDTGRARLAAIADALWQAVSTKETMEREIVAPVEARLLNETRQRAAQVAATKVDFFTLVRGEDA